MPKSAATAKKQVPKSLKRKPAARVAAVNAFVEIYSLRHPITGEVRYIGKANQASERLLRHLRDAKLCNRPVHCWIQKLGKYGLIPVVVVEQTVEADKWQLAEINAIKVARDSGVRLLNVADGGDMPHCPIHVRASNGRAVAKIRVNTPVKKKLHQMKMKLAMLLAQGYVRESTKEKMREAFARRPDLYACWANL